MSKTLYVNDLDEVREGTSVGREPFVLSRADSDTKRNGDPYMRLQFRDKSGQVEGRMWDTDAIDHEPGDRVVVDGEVDAYKGTKQIKVYDIYPLSEKHVQPEWFQPETPEVSEPRYETLLSYCQQLGDPYDDLTTSILETYERELKLWPAGESNHHAEFGDFLRHILNMVEVARSLSQFYPVDGDTVVAGCVVHDIGKLRTYSPEEGRTELEEMVGHMQVGCEIVDEHTDAEVTELKHIIMSHHGKNEWGSPVEPRTAEALLVHHIDNMDAKMDDYYEG